MLPTPPLSSPAETAEPSASPEVRIERSRESSCLDRKDFLMVGVLCAAVAAMFWRVLFTSDMFFFRDVYNYTYPHAKFIQEACRHGYLPYWNPYTNYGEPVLANPNFLFFYPTTLLIVLLPIGFAYCLHYILHFVIAALGTYWLARRWQQGRMAALFSASVFMFSGPLLSLGNFYNHVACAVWIPWALLATDYAVENRRPRSWILLTVVFALQNLAAEPFTLIATFGLCLAYALYRGGEFPRFFSLANLKLLGAFAAVGLMMLALTSVQFLPSWQLLRNSRRGIEGLAFHETAYWSFHPLLLLDILIANFFGPPLDAPSAWTFGLNCRNQPYYPSVFVGFVPFFFALGGLVLGQDRRRKPAAWAALFFLVLSMGQFTPLFALVYLLFPPLELVRFPVKLLIPAFLLLALLAGWGFDALRRATDDSSRGWSKITKLLGNLLAVALFVWLVSLLVPGWITGPASWVLRHTDDLFVRDPRSKMTPDQIRLAKEYLSFELRLHLPGLAGFILGGMVLTLGLRHGRPWAARAVLAAALLGVAQLTFVNYSANPTVPKSFYSYHPPVLSLARGATSPHRIAFFARKESSATVSNFQALLDFGRIPEVASLSQLAQSAFRARLLLSRGSLLEKAEVTANSDVELSFPQELFEFWVFMRSQNANRFRAACLLGRTNVKYLILSDLQTNPGIRKMAEVFDGSPDPSYLYEDLFAVPRVYVAKSAIRSESWQKTLELMARPELAAQDTVILAANQGARPHGVNPSLIGEGSNGLLKGEVPATSGLSTLGNVRILSRQPNQVTLQANVARSAYVVLLDRFDPDWHATVDGREVQVQRANQLFRAVQVEPGQHMVRFYYRQTGLKAGLVLSLLTLALLGTVYVADVRQAGTWHPGGANS